jgi:TolA-binding protein
MTSPGCPSEEELSVALGLDGDVRVARHVEGCASCRAMQASLREAIDHARQLPPGLPDPSRRDEVRASLLARGAADPIYPKLPEPPRMGRRREAWRLGFAAAAVAVVALAMRAGPPPPRRSHVSVRAGVGARYELSPPPWETVRLWEGTIDLEVDPLGLHDRVRVQVGDGEVEVRGTRFQVEAREDRLFSVTVAHGRVEVRPSGAAPTVLGAGGAWRAPAAAALPVPAALAPSLTPSPPPVVGETSPAPTPKTPSPVRREATRAEAGVERALRPTAQEQLYDDAWDALRARRFDDAAQGFARVVGASRGGALAGEASFWRATSLARGGHPQEAVSAFRGFVTGYPRSPRSGEASTILGWLLVDQQRADEAAPLFRGAIDDPDPNVRKSARDGLAALERR